jgi:hypothetical protein
VEAELTQLLVKVTNGLEQAEAAVVAALAVE